MAYILIDDAEFRYPFNPADLRAMHPDTSFPDALGDETLAGFGVYPVLEANVLPTAANEVAEEAAPALVDDVWVQQWTVREITDTEFAAHEVALHAEVDAAAGRFRLRFITDTAGQATTYDAKAKEAEAYAANPSGTYPFLSAEAEATGQTLAATAATVAATAAQWTLIGAAIEGARIAAKRAVTAAKDAGDWPAMGVAATIDWEGVIA